jgi:hypothetical protein
MMTKMCRVLLESGGQHLSAITNKLILDLIKQHYRPYDTHAEFGRGFSACQAGELRNPHEAESVSAQAWDRGVEAAMVFRKATAS